MAWVIPIDVPEQYNKEDEALYQRPIQNPEARDQGFRGAGRDAAPGQDRCLFMGERKACDVVFE